MPNGTKALWRSGYERKIREFLEIHRIPFVYEGHTLSITVKESPGTFCMACGSSACYRHSKYTPDFYFPNTGVYMEAKGKFDARARVIAVAMKEQHPSIDYRILLQRDNWMTSTKAQRYSDWLKKKQIPYAVGQYPPMDWVTNTHGSSGSPSGGSSRGANFTVPTATSRRY
jgi:hypothetical protein